MKYFTLEELTRSDTALRRGIKNMPNVDERLNLIALVGAVLDPLREAYGKPINVSSGFRCRAVNKAVGGVTGSQHVKGEAADIYVTKCVGMQKVTNKKEVYRLGRLIVELGNYDQVIFENVGTYNLMPEWIHVSWSRTSDNRRIILKKIKGKPGYIRIGEKEVLA